MSRRLSRLEQQILEALKPNIHSNDPSLEARTIATRIAGLRDTRNRDLPPGLRESVLRAIRSLAKKGLIAKDVRFGRLGGRFRGTYWMLAGVAVKDAEAEHKRKQKEAGKRERYEEEFSREEHKPKPQSPPTTRQASDGEVLKAARAAEKERKRLGLTWRGAGYYRGYGCLSRSS